MKYLLPVLVFSLCLVAIAPAPIKGWGGGGCPTADPVGPTLPVVTSPSTPYTWEAWTSQGPGVWKLRDRSDGNCAGCYRADDGHYYPWLGNGVWGEPTTPPINPPAAPLTGVVSDRIPPGVRSINGHPVTAAVEEATLTSAGGTLTDDSNKPFLVVVGTKDECDAVENDLTTRPELSALRSGVLFQSYRPNEWPVGNLYAGGHPDIVLEDHSGNVLGRLSSYPGPDGLRKIDPNYNPSLDPNPLAPPAASTSDLTSNPLVWIGLVGVGVVLYLHSRSKGTK